MKQDNSSNPVAKLIAVLLIALILVVVGGNALGYGFARGGGEIDIFSDDVSTQGDNSPALTVRGNRNNINITSNDGLPSLAGPSLFAQCSVPIAILIFLVVAFILVGNRTNKSDRYLGNGY